VRRLSFVLAGSLAGAFAALLAGPAAAHPLLEVGTLRAAPGESRSGFLEVPAAGDEPGTRVPVTLIHGARPGPLLALIAGNHGYEYAPILALQRLRSRVDPASMSGGLILVHVANPPSFLGRTVYYGPVDGKNLNRAYPGRADGTLSERIAWTITTQVIERADAVVDLHAGDGNESLWPFLYMSVGDDPAMDARIRELALASGFDYIVVDHERPTDPAASLYCDATAVLRGRPAITLESGALGGTDEAAIERSVAAGLGIMRQLGIAPGEPARVEHPVFLEPTEVLRSPVTGMLEPRVERGDSVAAGTVIATMRDWFGEPLAELRAPFAGLVLYVVATPPISEGEPVAMIGVPRDAPLSR